MKWIKQRENQIFFSVTIITILVAICPLLSKYTLLGHDSEYHLLRIEALKQQIEMGKPFLRVNPTFFGGAGYAGSLFYPDFLLYIPAIMRVLGFPIKTSYHFFMIICIVLCYTTSYICGKKISDNRYIGILFAVIITLSSYHLDDIMVRAAAGEYTAIIFVPLVLYGIYNLFYEDMDKPYILGIGMGLVLMCHTLSFVMCVILVCLMAVFNFETFIKKPRLLIKLFITAILTMLVTMTYLLPIAEQFIDTKFYVSKPWIMPIQEAVEVFSIFGFEFPTLGIALFVFLLPRVLIFKNPDDKIMKYADQCITTGLVFAVCASEIFPWDIVGKYISVVQFPWRLYLVSTVLLSFGAAVVVYRITSAIFIGASDTPEEYDDETKVIKNDGLVNKYGVAIAIVLAIMTVTTLFTLSSQTREYYDYSNDYYDYKPFTASVIAGEWLPISVTDPDSLVDEAEHAYDSNGREITFVRDKNSIVFDLDEPCEFVDVPFIYYKGYKAKTQTGIYLKADGSAKNGFTRVYTEDTIGEVKVSYEGTMIQKLSFILSLLTLLGILLFCFLKKHRKKMPDN